MKEIILQRNRGKVLVDEEDFATLSQFKWHIQKAANSETLFYAVCNGLLMHRAIISPGKGVHVDHRNGNGLDNRRQNLRPCTHTQNMRNRRPDRARPTTSLYKGVYWSKDRLRWVAQIYIDGKRSTKYFQSETDAARCYDARAIKHYGEFAWVNFPKENYL